MDNASSQSQKCGMCSSCGDSMPPWAPERVKKLTTAERNALFERLEEKRRRFVEERDARLRSTKQPHEQRQDHEENVQEQQHDLRDAEEPVQVTDSFLDGMDEAFDMPERESYQNGTPAKPVTEGLMTEIQLNSDSEHTSDREEAPHLPQSSHSPSTSPYASSQDAAPSHHSSVPCSPDSFHTAESGLDLEEATAALSLTPSSSPVLDRLSLEPPETPVPMELPLQTIPLTPSNNPNKPPLDIHNTPNGTRSLDTDFIATVEMEESPAPRPPPLSAVPSGLPPSPPSHPPPSPAMEPRSQEMLHTISLCTPPHAAKPCADCERWRERVRALEATVEELTGQVDRYKMQVTRLKARMDMGGRSHQQLISECEGLRMTTEFLFAKLEKAEQEKRERTTE